MCLIPFKGAVVLDIVIDIAVWQFQPLEKEKYKKKQTNSMHLHFRKLHFLSLVIITNKILFILTKTLQFCFTKIAFQQINLE